MTKKPGYLWAVIQQWLDAMPYPPSQNKLAMRLGVSASALGDYKYATHMPSGPFLERLADEIRVPYETVLDAALKDHGYRRPNGGEGDRHVSAAATKTPDSGPGNIIEIAGNAARRTGRPTRAQQREQERKTDSEKDQSDPS